MAYSNMAHENYFEDFIKKIKKKSNIKFLPTFQILLDFV